MAEPQEPLSLFKLACVAMRKDAKNGNLKLRLGLHNVSPDVKKCIWDQCSLMEIITLCADLGSTEIFSHIIRSKEIEVYAYKSVDKMCTIKVSCIGKPTLTWFITSERLEWHTAYEWDNTYFELKVGNVCYSAYKKASCIVSEVFELNLPDHAQADIANWVYRLFRNDIC
ncbi:hypothetical protein CAEBREN_17899 [Caenorhabditis brenneri]|uniref:Uncharacterized protein n=1 Tax=Caenorhabditis brenneri TaxID=135651 RepID=G0MAA3_CAEBE|nr:hypothetical protein CAEBREN_17899 [Caenorhabditis brenneri]